MHTLHTCAPPWHHCRDAQRMPDHSSWLAAQREPPVYAHSADASAALPMLHSLVTAPPSLVAGDTAPTSSPCRSCSGMQPGPCCTAWEALSAAPLARCTAQAASARCHGMAWPCPCNLAGRPCLASRPADRLHRPACAPATLPMPCKHLHAALHHAGAPQGTRAHRVQYLRLSSSAPHAPPCAALHCVGAHALQ